MSIHVASLSVAIEKNEILNGITFDLPEGSWLMLIGPNGAGKSTLIKAISGYLPSHGNIEIEGTDIRNIDHTELAMKMAVLCQNQQQVYGFTAE